MYQFWGFQKKEGGVMKKKALVMALVFVMGLAMVVGTAQAAWYTCSVQQTGFHEAGIYIVYLTDLNTPGSTSTPFIIVGGNQNFVNGMYAGALTAFANSTNVVVDLGSFSAWDACYSLWASK
jgi:hypothetical protein